MNWSYVAGLIDGEGSISKGKYHNSYRVGVFIDITNKEVLGEIQKFSGIGHIYIPKKRKIHWKQNYIYAIQSHKDVEKFLKNVKPYLIIKKEKCNDVLELIRTNKWRERINLDKNELLKLKNEGLSLRMIANIFNVSHETVRKQLGAI